MIHAWWSWFQYTLRYSVLRAIAPRQPAAGSHVRVTSSECVHCQSTTGFSSSKSLAPHVFETRSQHSSSDLVKVRTESSGSEK